LRLAAARLLDNQMGYDANKTPEIGATVKPLSAWTKWSDWLLLASPGPRQNPMRTVCSP